jgi:hypothetical protein
VCAEKKGASCQEYLRLESFFFFFTKKKKGPMNSVSFAIYGCLLGLGYIEEMGKSDKTTLVVGKKRSSSTYTANQYEIAGNTVWFEISRVQPELSEVAKLETRSRDLMMANCLINSSVAPVVINKGINSESLHRLLIERVNNLEDVKDGYIANHIDKHL